jgi:hypothetical protein
MPIFDRLLPGSSCTEPFSSTLAPKNVIGESSGQQMSWKSWTCGLYHLTQKKIHTMFIIKNLCVVQSVLPNNIHPVIITDNTSSSQVLFLPERSWGHINFPSLSPMVKTNTGSKFQIFQNKIIQVNVSKGSEIICSVCNFIHKAYRIVDKCSSIGIQEILKSAFFIAHRK